MRRIVLFGISIVCVLVSLGILFYSIGKTSLVGIAVFPMWFMFASFNPETGQTGFPIVSLLLLAFELAFVYMNFYFIKTVLKWSISFSTRLKDNMVFLLNVLSFLSIFLSVTLIISTLIRKDSSFFVFYESLSPAFKYEETNLFLSNLLLILTFLSAAFLIYLNIRFIKWVTHRFRGRKGHLIEQS
ncbi:hypothetical protein ABID52_000569 [Fictibacillus halophilus]|uniref:Uncharacterized protein n=1 Tax=Fictibacillus halophilus TaxID=1610490 RepID=A0ABV2LEH2_9BACL|nr:hypothetical protein [Fictibacillus halophilus]